MATIQSTIGLYDSFSPVLYNVMDAVNLTIASVGQMQNALNADVDMVSLDNAMDSIHQAGAAMAALNEQLESHSNVNINMPTPQPIQVPVHWEADNMEVFTNTGVERFQQEVQSANAMLEQLCSTQNEIARQSYNTGIFPREAFQDLNSLSVRIDAICDRIQQIENNPVNLGTEEANASLEQLRTQLNMAVQQQNNLNTAIQNMDVNAANTAYLQLENTIGNTERYIRDNADEQGRFNQLIRDGTANSNNLMNSIKRIAATYLTIHSIGEVFSISDELTQTTARLNLMNNAFEESGMEQQELMNTIYRSAQNARASYGDMASLVARFGNNAKDAFGSSAEVVDFANLVQKEIKIAGATTQESSAAMLQLSQALGSGVLRGDELNSIFEQAPNLIQNIADYMEVPIGQIRGMAADGEITADIVKAAVFAATDEINQKFEEMPMTWGDLWTSFQNNALVAFQPVLERLNYMANNDTFQTFVNGAVQTLAILANAVLNVFDAMGSIAGFVIDNWYVIAPVILGVAAAMAVYTLFTKGAEIATKAAQLATRVWTAVQGVFNTVMSMNPVALVIIAIILLIAIIYAVVAIINKVTGSSISAAGVICGVIATVGAILINTAIGAINAVLQFIWSLFVEPFIGIIEWVLNVANGGFDSFGDAVANLIGNIIAWFLSLGKVVTKIIDAIFGTNWTSGLSSLQNEVLAWGKNEDAITLDRSAWQIDYRMNYTDAWNAGYGFGEGIDNAISRFSLSDIFGSTNIPGGDYTNAGADAYGDAMAAAADNTGKTAKNTADIADALDITSEDLKYLRDIAEREVIDRTVLKSVTIDMSGMTNKVENMQDLDGIGAYLAKSLRQQMEVSMEGA